MQENNIRVNKRKTFVGEVVGTKMNKTAVVEIETKTLHPKFGKLVVKHKRVHIHDEKNECVVGDKVELIETRPLSKTKFFRLKNIILRKEK